MKWKAKKKRKAATPKRHVMHARSARASRFPLRAAHSRFILWALFLSLFVFVLSYGGASAWSYVQRNDAFPITNIAVHGDLSHVSVADIQATVRSHLNGGFFSLSLQALVTALEANPWIAEVSFRKTFPNALSVHVVEKKPIARFGATGVVTQEGNVFYPSQASLPINLPMLFVSQKKIASSLSFFEAVQDVLAQSSLKLARLSNVKGLGWRVQLVNGVKVMLGNEEPIIRFERFVHLYQKIHVPKRQKIASVDLRYQNGFAVRFADPILSPS